MDKKLTKAPHVRLHRTHAQRVRTWHELTECERDELLTPTERSTLGLWFFAWEYQFVRATVVATTMLGVSTAQFRKLLREYATEIDHLEIEGRRLFRTPDLLLMKADLLHSRGTGV
ncbi:hypothetical protein [Mesorhizobium sp.]|uniref:hypothetical protein n=1 Tax=Mesorhizobium sp. TaxID=1871066 RepID=UPI000FE7D531|nr:hypothetical protein [Mesorhizobium sp.]RWN24295.1 MAG: hypothetical protein EOR95_33550 [Mesorhizobium sp.]